MGVDRAEERMGVDRTEAGWVLTEQRQDGCRQNRDRIDVDRAETGWLLTEQRQDRC